MLDKEELRQAVFEAELGRYWPDIERIVRPTIYMESDLVKDSELPVGASKSGGIPDVPPGFIWPEDEDGPCVFLAQINLEQTTPFDVENLLPKTGLLSFFHNANGMTGGSGILSQDPVFYFSQVDDLVRATPVYDGEYRDEQYYENCLKLLFYNGWSSPSFDTSKADIKKDDNREEIVRLYEFLEKPTTNQKADLLSFILPKSNYYMQFPNRYITHYNNHLLGHPDDYQGDLEPQAELAFRNTPGTRWDATDDEKAVYSRLYKEVTPQSYQDWICLLCDGTYCGGVFTLDYLIRREDLVRADFSKTVAFAVN